MVSYYNSAAMYRHQQASNCAQYPSGSPMHPWYTGYHHQGPQMSSASNSAFCMQQEEQQMGWHHPAGGHPHMFHQEFSEFVGHNGMPHLQHQHQMAENDDPLPLPSPPITVSGSEMSSPGGGEAVTPPQPPSSRPPPVRSPYEWIKKTSYQTQPNPGKCIFLKWFLCCF